MTHPRYSIGRLTCLACAFAILILSANAASAERPARLRYDPFRPLPHDADARVQGSQRNSPAAFDPSLRSTVVAGANSLANLGGEILGLGEEKKGYRLIEVRPFEAIFDKDGTLIRIPVDPTAAGEGQ